MNMLQSFIDNSSDEVIKSYKNMIMNFYCTHRKKISKSEWEDFQQDIICCILVFRDKFDETKSDFSTFMSYQFQELLQNIITKYTGIKMNYYQYNKFKQDNKKLVILSLEDREV